jgi:hypothetical protein
VLEAVFILLEFPSPSRRIFISSHSLPPSLVRRIGPSRSGKRRLTFDLFLLRVKGLARVLSRLPQAKNLGFLLLEGLAQILVRDTKLV